MAKRIFLNGLHGSPEYKTWVNVRKRCYQQNSKTYPNYGGKGIVMCEEWKDSFLVFLKDMGKKPSSDHSIDRIDNSLGYSPNNCRWATRQQQCENKTNNIVLTWEGELVCRAVLAKRYQIRPQNLVTRLKNGWNFEDAIKTPFKIYKTKLHEKRSFVNHSFGYSL